jgi:hypothetical protein
LCVPSRKILTTKNNNKAKSTKGSGAAIRVGKTMTEGLLAHAGDTSEARATPQAATHCQLSATMAQITNTRIGRLAFRISARRNPSQTIAGSKMI